MCGARVEKEKIGKEGGKALEAFHLCVFLLGESSGELLSPRVVRFVSCKYFPYFVYALYV